MVSPEELNLPDNLKYTKTHEWAKIEGNRAKIGITDYAQLKLNDIVYVELPNVGDEIKKGETFGVVESVKAASDIYAPLSGKVVAVNDDVVNSPEVLNEDPYTNYLIEIEMSDPSEAADLLDVNAYKKVVEEEEKES